MIIEPEEIFHCPYCDSVNSLSIDYSGGKRQKFVNDCETCCRPILIKIAIDGTDTVCISVDKENA